MSRTLAPEQATRTAIDALQKALVELIDLALQTKQAHWNVVGPRFKDVHVQLDVLTDDFRMWSDEIAERVTALRGAPDGRAATVARMTQLDPFPDGEVRDATVIELITARMEDSARRFRELVEATGDEPVTEDLLIGVLGGIEKHLWMIRSQNK